MFEEAISRKTLHALDLVARAKILPPKTYLAGGTALALQLGHRYSYDLDFFTPLRFETREVLERFKKIPGFALERTSWQTVLGSVSSIRTTLFFYQYPLLFKARKFRGIEVADRRDIAAMKIAAISDRGTKRDFVDLFFLLKSGVLGLKEAVILYEKKFKVAERNRIHILKSLVYFDDAERDKMPRMIQYVDWTEVKKTILGETKKLAF
jgi:predicted nucleotidyltransferase component of viral defense system